MYEENAPQCFSIAQRSVIIHFRFSYGKDPSPVPACNSTPPPSSDAIMIYSYPFNMERLLAAFFPPLPHRSL